MTDPIDPADYASSAPDSLDIWLIRVLQTLLTERSVTQAALRLGQTQPAISTALRRLRELLHDPILVRGKQGMVPTEYGASLLPAVQRTLREVEFVATPHGAFDPTTSRRTFRIAAPDYLNDFFMPTLIRAFRVAAPNARLEIESLTPTLDHERALDEGDLDLVIGNWENPEPRFARRDLFTDSFVCLMRRGHPATHCHDHSVLRACAASAAAIRPDLHRHATLRAALRRAVAAGGHGVTDRVSAYRELSDLLARGQPPYRPGLVAGADGRCLPGVDRAVRRRRKPVRVSRSTTACGPDANSSPAPQNPANPSPTSPFAILRVLKKRPAGHVRAQPMGQSRFFSDINPALTPMSTEAPLSRRADLAITGRIVSVVTFTFICYLTIGVPLAVLPGFVHTDLGYGSVMAGVAISVQYFATLASRPLAGRTADTIGPKRTVLHGLTACGASGVLLLGAALAQQWHGVSLALLIIGRLVLGFGESWVGTAAITWGIGRVGTGSSGRVISWNGIATYGALAIGAPLGVAMERSLGFASLGVFVIALGGLGYWLATRMAAVPIVHGERMSYRSVFFRVLPHGMGLALGSAGFGSIATFITLFYAAHNWPDAALSLTVFGTMFVGSRLLFANTIKVFGGFRVAIVSFGFECVGLLMLWLAADPAFALAGAALTGFGFALIFPALGVEAVGLVPPASRGAALSAYSVFLDLSLGVTGPLAGYVAGEFGFSSVYLFAAVASAAGVALTVAMYMRTGRGVGGAATA